MKECQCCLSPTREGTTICDICGYDFENRCITDATRLRRHVKELKDAKEWISEVELKRRVHDIQATKRGPWRFRVSDDGRDEVGGRNWTFRSAARLLKEQKSQIHTDLRLAKALLKYPEFNWRDCRNKRQAIDTMDEFDLLGVPPFFVSEADLQKFIEDKWVTIPFLKEWSWIGSAVKIKRGEIDLLAKHRTDAKWLVVELKKGLADYKAVGEVLRYMGAVSREKAEDKEVVEGLIIAAGAAETLRDPIGKASNVKFMAYFIDKGKIELLPTPPALNPCFVRRIRTQGYDSVIEQLEKVSVETGTE